MGKHYQYLALLALSLAVAAAPVVRQASATEPSGRIDPGGTDVPPEALQALKAGRYWRASRILNAYLEQVADTTPTALLLAAQADAGWDAWARVDSLLTGRSWLDSVGGGKGWALLGRSRFEEGDWAGSAQDFGRFLSAAGGAGDRARGIALVQKGRALTRAGESAAAQAALDSAFPLLPRVRDWIALYAAQAAAEGGDTVGVRHRLAGAGAGLATYFGWIIQVRAHLQASDTAGALAVARRATATAPSDRARARAYDVAAGLRLDLGDTAIARTDYRLAMRHAPTGTAGVDAARALSQLPGLSATDQLHVGQLYLRNGNPSRGSVGLKAYLAAGAGSASERRRLRYELARAYFDAGDYHTAEKQLDALLRHEPSRSVAADMLYLVGRAQYRAGQHDRAFATFRRTAARYAGTRAATQALFLIADLSHDQGDTARARLYYRRTIGSNAGTNEAGLAAMRLADLALVHGDSAHARRIFDEYRRHFPDGRRVQEATYWAALMREPQAPRTARTLFHRAWKMDPFSYYGLRAADRLGLSLADAPLKPSPSTPRATRLRVQNGLSRLDVLRDIGDDSAAGYEVDHLRRRFEGADPALYTLAEALNARGYTVEGIRIGWLIHGREHAWNRRLLRIVYPFPYRKLVLAEARDHDLDPFLMAGLIRQESMFKSDVVSGAGAVGLMQVLPKTGSILARAEDINHFDANMLVQPEINLHLGAMYLSDLLNTYDHSLPAVLAAYNAGPSRVDRWRTFPEWGRPNLFTERIPFAETRAYVRIVQGNADLYRMLYGPTPADAVGGNARGGQAPPTATADSVSHEAGPDRSSDR